MARTGSQRGARRWSFGTTNDECPSPHPLPEAGRGGWEGGGPPPPPPPPPPPRGPRGAGGGGGGWGGGRGAGGPPPPRLHAVAQPSPAGVLERPGNGQEG